MCATEIFAGTGWYFDIAPTLVFLKKTIVKLDRLQQLFAKQGWVRVWEGRCCKAKPGAGGGGEVQAGTSYYAADQQLGGL